MIPTGISRDALSKFASKEVTRLTLSQFYTAGRYLLKHQNNDNDNCPDKSTAFKMTAGFLYRELPIRISQTIAGLEQNPSPYNICKVPGLNSLIDRYAKDLSLLVDKTSEPNSPESNEVFLSTLRRLKMRYRKSMWMISQGLRELSTAINESDPGVVPDFLQKRHPTSNRMRRPRLHGLGGGGGASGTAKALSIDYMTAPSGMKIMGDPNTWPEQFGRLYWKPNKVCATMCGEVECRNLRDQSDEYRCAEIQGRRFFDWLYTMNLGTQLLIEDHVSIRDHGHNLVRIIDPLKIATKAVNDAREICRKHYGFESPEVRIVSPAKPVTTTYVPHHLYSLLFEVLKNALRATVEFHGNNSTSLGSRNCSSMPKIALSVFKGEEDVTFKIADCGGGIPLSQVDAIWSYLRTTYNPLSSADVNGMESSKAVLFGAGDGLPMGRQVARYFGGDLDLVSMEGAGTDVYVHLSRPHMAVEQMPDLDEFLSMSTPYRLEDLVISNNEPQKTAEAKSEVPVLGG